MALAAAVGVAVAVFFLVVIPVLRTPQPADRTRSLTGPPPVRAGLPERGPARSGPARRGWTEEGTLRLLDLGSCRQSVVLAGGTRPPVRFSPDGRWVAFGEGDAVPAAGGPVERPFGSGVRSWAWSPVPNLLAAVTEGGGVQAWPPGGLARTLLPDGSGTVDVAFAPSGASLPVARAGVGIQVRSVSGRGARTVLPVPDRAAVPVLAGWSPDGRWILYRPGPVGASAGSELHLVWESP
jgi:hypothetical protein